MEKMNFKSLYFELTHFCNQNCKHCYLDGGIQHNLYELNLESIKRIFDKFKKQGGKFVTITGGEPFARKDIIEILDYLEKLELNFLIASNGILLTESIIKKLSSYNHLKLIHTSILGSTTEEHNYIANRNSFDKVLDNLSLFDKYKIESYVQVTLRRDLMDKIPKIAKMLSEYNCTMKFTPILLVCFVLRIHLSSRKYG